MLRISIHRIVLDFHLLPTANFPFLKHSYPWIFLESSKWSVIIMRRIDFPIRASLFRFHNSMFFFIKEVILVILRRVIQVASLWGVI